jgi:hypothetical protein
MALHEAEVIAVEAAESVAAARILERAQAARADNALTNEAETEIAVQADGPFLKLYRVAMELVAEADEVAVAEEVEMAVVHEPLVEVDKDDINDLFNNKEEVDTPATSDEQVALLA